MRESETQKQRNRLLVFSWLFPSLNVDNFLRLLSFVRTSTHTYVYIYIYISGQVFITHLRTIDNKYFNNTNVHVKQPRMSSGRWIEHKYIQKHLVRSMLCYVLFVLTDLRLCLLWIIFKSIMHLHSNENHELI